MNDGKGGGVNDGFRTSRVGDLMADIAVNLGIRKAGKVVMDGDALAGASWTGFRRVLLR